MEKYFLILICISLVVISFRLWHKNFSKIKQQKKRFKRGLKLEKKAAKFLISKGFTILGNQVEYQHTYFVNNEETVSTINIDYLVEKKNEIFVVEVKSGKSAISIKNRNTRRQLLEYAVAIECNGVYLLDMENKDLQLIEFQFLNTTLVTKPSNGLLFTLMSIIIILSIIYRFLF